MKKKGKDHTTDEENTSNGKPVEIKEPVEQEEIDYKDKYLRALADYQNLLKRVEKEKQDFVQYANERLILNLLEIIDDFERAKDKVMMGAERKSVVMSQAEKFNTAYHEAGHALVASVLPHADPVHKISIISRGRAAGYTLKLPIDERKLQSKNAKK